MEEKPPATQIRSSPFSCWKYVEDANFHAAIKRIENDITLLLGTRKNNFSPDELRPASEENIALNIRELAILVDVAVTSVANILDIDEMQLIHWVYAFPAHTQFFDPPIETRPASKSYGRVEEYMPMLRPFGKIRNATPDEGILFSLFLYVIGSCPCSLYPKFHRRMALYNSPERMYNFDKFPTGSAGQARLWCLLAPTDVATTCDSVLASFTKKTGLRVGEEMFERLKLPKEFDYGADHSTEIAMAPPMRPLSYYITVHGQYASDGKLTSHLMDEKMELFLTLLAAMAKSSSEVKSTTANLLFYRAIALYGGTPKSPGHCTTVAALPM